MTRLDDTDRLHRDTTTVDDAECDRCDGTGWIREHDEAGVVEIAARWCPACNGTGRGTR